MTVDGIEPSVPSHLYRLGSSNGNRFELKRGRTATDFPGSLGEGPT